MKVLYITTVSSTMNAFFKPHIEMLVRDGNHVDLACNYDGWPLDEFYHQLGCEFYQIDFSRSPLSPDNLKAYKQLKAVIACGRYDIVHCHTPNASVITRLVCKKLRKRAGLKVFYTAHGFHFYKGAPLINWMLYYPVEWLCAHFTDVLITINQEDYQRAQKHMHAKSVEYVPGVGIDLKKFGRKTVDRREKRHELGIPEDAVLLLSVGEVNTNKNHQVILRAMAELKDPNMYYMIAGVGDQMEYLERLADELAIAKRFHLLGYRTDVDELYQAADIFCFPSLREGLGLAALEAMAYGLPLVTSNVHGINDYSKHGLTGFKCAPNDIAGFSTAFRHLSKTNIEEIQKNNMRCVLKYDISVINHMMKMLYSF